MAFVRGCEFEWVSRQKQPSGYRDLVTDRWTDVPGKAYVEGGRGAVETSSPADSIAPLDAAPDGAFVLADDPDFVSLRAVRTTSVPAPLIHMRLDYG